MGVNPIGGATRRAAFLDRDGVINRAFVRDGVPHPPATLADVELLPGVAGAIDALSDAGFVVIVVTNQPDVARGTQSRDTVEAINLKLRQGLRIDDLVVCYHDNADNCLCRKPKPGMLIDAAEKHGIDLASSVMVGDRWSDAVAGAAAGCATFLIDTPYSQRDRCRPDHIVRDLVEAARIICHTEETQ